jgi:hypothetical protein
MIHEDQALSPLYDPVSKLSLFLILPVCRPASLRTGVGEGMGKKKSYDGGKAWSSINN